MSNGEQTYAALKAGVLKTLIDSFNPDWDSLARDAYIAFIKDAQDDTKLEIYSNTNDPDTELVVQAYILDEEDARDLCKPLLLSDMLLDAIWTYGKEDALRALNLSLAKVYAKLETNKAGVPINEV